VFVGQGTRRGQRHQNRRDVERGGQDQAHRAQELKNSDGLEGTGAEVFDPCRGGAHAGHLLLDTNILALLPSKTTANNPATIHSATFMRFLPLWRGPKWR
jgi:hypothetical protein